MGHGSLANFKHTSPDTILGHLGPHQKKQVEWTEECPWTEKKSSPDKEHQEI